MKVPGKPEKKRITWMHLVLGVDLFLVVITALGKTSLHYPGKGKLTRLFNLAVEMNLGVWWSGACLLALGLIAWELYCRQEKARLPWLILAFVLAALSLDEIGSIHERIGSWSALLPFGVVLCTLVAFSLATLYRDKQTRRSALLIAGAFFIFGSVALQERLGDIGIWPLWAEGIRVGVEEGSELMGIFLMFLALIPLRAKECGNAIRAAVPDPRSMSHLTGLVLTGLFLQSLASLFVPSYIDVTEKGNPLVWYSAAAFFLLFSAAFWKSLDPAEAGGRSRAALALFSLGCSAALCYHPGKFSRDLNGMVPAELLPGVLLFCITAGVLLISTRIPGVWPENRKYFPLVLLLPVLSLLSGSPEGHSLVSGLTAYLVFTFYRPLYQAQGLTYPQDATELKTGNITLIIFR